MPVKIVTDSAADLTAQQVADHDIRVVPLKIRFGDEEFTDGVDLTVREGEIVALVGESGCGKTTVARTIMRLSEATSGSVSRPATTRSSSRPSVTW